MKKFLIFLTIIGVITAAAFAFFTVTPVGKDIWSNITTKVDTVETVDNTDDTDNTVESETNNNGLTKEKTLDALKQIYAKYQKTKVQNKVDQTNYFANNYNCIVEDSKKTWKNFASLMEAEGLPESLPIIETN